MMKLTAFLLAACLQVSAAGYAQTVTLSETNTPLRTVLKKIEKQTGYHFVYREEWLNHVPQVSVRIQDVPLQQALDMCFSKQPFSWMIIGKTVALKLLPPVSPENKEAIRATIHGRVTDEKGTPLPGVSIRLKDAGLGVISDADGNYSLQLPGNTGTLIFTSVGFTTREVTWSGQPVLDVILKMQSTGLGEVVAVGYGSVTKRDLTGSVASIRADEIAQSKVTSIQEAIQGKLAGVQISSVSGEPGSAMNISIRGANTIYGGASPLFVIDGIPYDANSNEVAGASIGNGTASNPLATLNPADIASVDVLKDASATAIYGSRGANGVVIITTKSGKAGQSKIDYDGSMMLSSATRKLPVLSADEYLDYRRIVSPNTILFYKDTNKDGLYNDQDEPVDLTKLPKHDWQREILRTGVTQTHNLGVSGKKNGTSFAGGVGYLGQSAIISNNDYHRYNVRLKLDHEHQQRLKLGLNVSTAFSELNGATQSGGGDALFNGVVQNLVISKPVEFYDPLWDRAGQYISPVTMINNADKNVTVLQTNMSGYVNYKLAEGLSLNVSGGGILTSSKGKEFYGKLTSWGVGDNGLGILQEQRAYSLFNTNQLTYEKWFSKDHYLNAMVAFETSKYNYEFFSLQKSNFADESTGINDISKGTNVKASGSYRDVNKRLSYFGRINYTLLTKHLFTATFRADGSDKFGAGKRFGYFPSFAYSWLLTEESFMKAQKIFSDLKLRLSYGQTGNERITSYRYLSALENAYYAGDLGLAPASRANPDLKWETTIQYNAGIDVGVLNNRLEFSADIYSKKTKDMLLPAYVPSRTGYIQQWQNLGRVDNSGIEIRISSKNIDHRDFQWQTDFNISSNRNEVKDIGNIGFIPVTMGGGWIQDVGRVTAGQPIGTAYGYVFDGVYQIGDFTWQNNNDPAIPHEKREYKLKDKQLQIAGVNVRPGSFKFKDLNNDGVIDLDHDRTTISRSQPKFFGGINNTFHYRNFDFNVFLEGSYGAQVFNESRYQLEGGVMETWMNITKDFFAHRWSTENPTNERGDFGALNKTAMLSSSYYVEDASYLRLKSISIGYRIPAAITEKKGISAMRVYFTGANLFTWTKYTGYDPELNSGNPLLPGFDRISYPRSKSFTLGLNVSF
ncbi:SusC/RagA family TonB-linked outer membrane protein [Chitinophaga qingshengii]|uniref:TonB-dependent receptor n=1 Tax=Chitinophaga qingshengii TaxID=1569794 RepID=A0ABR7TIT3_9BACT|nr:TonB-dependent receptor [Chitinophaga qingshengii]MBC9928974.1 TonB-dependent receptor [Chitinophaga qingshengii]